ncbi:MAG: cytochrome P460 family protein [Pseudomonadota bacterium]
MKSRGKEVDGVLLPQVKGRVGRNWIVDLCLVGAIALAVVALGSAARSQMMTGEGAAPLPDRRPIAWGTADDIAFAKDLWPRLLAAKLVGAGRLQAFPRKGERPHGAVQQVTAVPVPFGDAKRRVIVKANHRGEGLTPKVVWTKPNDKLTGYAVMAKRASGYDAKNSDWFWAVFNPDGTVRQFDGRAIAGRVDTGNTNGCIGCHVKKGGDDLETMTAK